MARASIAIRTLLLDFSTRSTPRGNQRTNCATAGLPLSRPSALPLQQAGLRSEQSPDCCSRPRHSGWAQRPRSHKGARLGGGRRVGWGEVARRAAARGYAVVLSARPGASSTASRRAAGRRARPRPSRAARPGRRGVRRRALRGALAAPLARRRAVRRRGTRRGARRGRRLRRLMETNFPTAELGHGARGTLLSGRADGVVSSGRAVSVYPSAPPTRRRSTRSTATSTLRADSPPRPRPACQSRSSRGLHPDGPQPARPDGRQPRYDKSAATRRAQTRRPSAPPDDAADRRQPSASSRPAPRRASAAAAHALAVGALRAHGAAGRAGAGRRGADDGTLAVRVLRATGTARDRGPRVHGRRPRAAIAAAGRRARRRARHLRGGRGGRPWRRAADGEPATPRCR